MQNGSTVKEEDQQTTVNMSEVALPKGVGLVATASDGIAAIVGFENVIHAGAITVYSTDSIGKVVKTPGLIYRSVRGVALVMLFGDDQYVKCGDVAVMSKNGTRVQVGIETIGRVVDSLGAPLDGFKKPEGDDMIVDTSIVPGVVDRQSVCEPLLTGITLIDSVTPIGRGQRQLFIGDKGTGKTAAAIDAITNQRNNRLTNPTDVVYCIYVSIGQRMALTKSILTRLRNRGCMTYTTIVSATASAPAAMQWLSPYTGCALGEYYRDQGRHALVIYDDLTQHAIAHRQVTILGRGSTGRDAYATDVFYQHSRLLERAAKMNALNFGGSLTAIPVIEVQENDISAFIPTNVISITDGQTYFDSRLSVRNVWPAINVNLSVSRVGTAAQTKLMKRLTSQLRLSLARFRTMEHMVSQMSELEDDIQQFLKRGIATVEILKQNWNSVVSAEAGATYAYLATKGFLDSLSVKETQLLRQRVRFFFSFNSIGEMLAAVVTKSHVSSAFIQIAKLIVCLTFDKRAK